MPLAVPLLQGVDRFANQLSKLLRRICLVHEYTFTTLAYVCQYCLHLHNVIRDKPCIGSVECSFIESPQNFIIGQPSSLAQPYCTTEGFPI